MLSAMQLFFVLSITLIVLSTHFVNGVPINSDASDEINTPMDEESSFHKRKLPVEGILIGRRSFPSEGILIGRRSFPSEGILLGKREFPNEGILLGKRNLRFFAPKSMGHNRYEN